MFLAYQCLLFTKSSQKLIKKAKFDFWVACYIDLDDTGTFKMLSCNTM